MKTDEAMDKREKTYYFNAKEFLIIAVIGIVGALTVK
jgi:hypothetical protein